MQPRRPRAPAGYFGDLFEIFPDIPRPFHVYTPKWVVAKHLERLKAKAQSARAQAASIVGQHRVESERRRAYMQRLSRRP
jgi:hypothetical protein